MASLKIGHQSVAFEGAEDHLLLCLPEAIHISMLAKESSG